VNNFLSIVTGLIYGVINVRLAWYPNTRISLVNFVSEKYW